MASEERRAKNDAIFLPSSSALRRASAGGGEVGRARASPPRRERGEWRVADVMSTAYVCTHVAGAPPERPPAERVCKGEKRACGPMLQARARTMVSV